MLLRADAARGGGSGPTSFAVLAYNLNTYVLDDKGNERQRRARKVAEAYRLIDGEWHIVHSNWAFTQTATGAIAA